MNEAPFKTGDKVSVAQHHLVVVVCWKSHPFSPLGSTWQVRGYGQATSSNPKGRYVFSAADAVLLQKGEQS